MAKDNDDSLEFDFNDLDLNDFDLDLDFDVKEEDFKETDSSALSEAEIMKETSGANETDEKSDNVEIDEDLLGDHSEENVHNEENSSDSIQEDTSNDFDDLFSLLGMGDVNEQEIFSSMMDSIPDSDDEGKNSDFAMDEEVEDIKEDAEKTAGSSMNDIYSDVLGAVGALEDKEAEEQLLSELEDIEDRTNSKKKSKKNKKERKEK
ncbi:MAG: hypothetical protein IJA10_01280 [Lachnospiraceae bacterium]|nr:hypothetical protein [Lachnospiraceae bacterium]